MITSDDIAKTPSACGVYIFWAHKTPIYVGKAVNIRARLTGHLYNARHIRKEKQIIQQADKITHQQIDYEVNALLYEARLIKKYHPKYNLASKDDKSPLYIKITREPYPKVLLTRAENDGSSYYFGPFSSKNTAAFLIRHIRGIIPFCIQKKTSLRPCFYSKIGLCTPCPNAILRHIRENGHDNTSQRMTRTYRRNITRIISILEGDAEKVIESLRTDIERSSKAQEYENALYLRDQLTALSDLLTRRRFERGGFEPINNNRIKKLKEQFEDFMVKYFNCKPKKTVSRIECFDISNLQGQLATASMVVFHDFLPDKGHYRRFRIKTVHKISDFDMIAEVIKRRLDNRSRWALPDLLIVDGGRPQLQTVRKVCEKEGVLLPTIGLAKKPDRLIVSVAPPHMTRLTHQSELFAVFQQLRDESHRFARAYHLTLRKKRILL